MPLRAALGVMTVVVIKGIRIQPLHADMAHYQLQIFQNLHVLYLEMNGVISVRLSRYDDRSARRREQAKP